MVSLRGGYRALALVIFCFAFLALPALAADPLGEDQLAGEMLALINGEREERGLPRLTLDEDLTAVAREHAQDMIRGDYFSHWSPEGHSPADRLEEARIPCQILGENLAGHTSVHQAHVMLMDSPSHQANILEGRYCRTGIALVPGGPYGMMMAMLFTD